MAADDQRETSQAANANSVAVSARMEAVSRAIADHDRMLTRWLKAKFGDAETARDLAQETYLRVWSFARSNPVEHPRALLFKTAANLAANEFRSRKTRRRAHPPRADGELEPGDWAPTDEPSPERVVAAQSDARALIAVIDQLPDNVRRAFVMSRFEEKSYREIAKSLLVSVSSVEKYIITALERLRDAVNDKETATPAERARIIPFPRPKAGQAGKEPQSHD